MNRGLLLLLCLLAASEAVGQGFRDVLSFPDRLMSGTAIGRVSQHRSAALPEWDRDPVAFAPEGTLPVSADLDFLGYLREMNLKEDLLVQLSGAYAPSDTLDYLRARALFDVRKLEQAAEHFAAVPASSPYGAAAQYYGLVSRAYLGDYAMAVPADGTELAAYEGAGLALLRGDATAYRGYAARFGYADYALAEGERVMDQVARRFERPAKKAWLAALASAVIPGSGKIYAGRTGEGISAFLTVGTLGAITAEQGIRHGWRDWRTLVAGSLCAVFYLGNIYGSYLSLEIEQNEILASDHTVVLLRLHLPLRELFP